ncbi:MAG: hypothetical protein CVU48_05685 [Candidatus Cloacimonetes bacterium HGW-Cloacimonetes-1]|jgi:hypothetical protein|nr:MAG: hypothetical protein CVU48_05685 [Candidatus Cloacimonetes bacterium HGW-Cloacimonetes-1]
MIKDNKLLYALIVILPIATALLGGALIYGGFPQFKEFEPNSGSPSAMHIYLGAAIIIGVISLLYKYIQSRFYWFAAILLPLIFAISSRIFLGGEVKIYQYFVPMLVFGILSTIIVSKVFYFPVIQRFRTILFALLSALALTLFYRAFYIMIGVPIEPGFWINKYVNSLYLFIFIGFGMSFADLIIMREVMSHNVEQTDRDDEEEEEN